MHTVSVVLEQKTTIRCKWLYSLAIASYHHARRLGSPCRAEACGSVRQLAKTAVPGGFSPDQSENSICGLDHGIGHYMIFEVDLEAQAPAPPMPKWLRTSSAASDRRTVLPLSSRQAG